MQIEPDNVPPPPPIPEFVEWELQNFDPELRQKMTTFADQVWFRSMPEEGQRQTWYTQLAVHKREEEDLKRKRDLEEEKKKIEEQKVKDAAKKKKLQGNWHFTFSKNKINTFVDL